ncbi:MAG: phosphatidate cytidylyltransferase [Alphaproteobacteria bacterium]|nr:phosphatidate cytidylyltransferase [Alphaproteobacteria bacterium]
MSTADQFLDLKTRLISAVILAIAAFLCIYFGSIFMLLMVSAFCYVGMKEWMDLPKRRNYSTTTKRKWFGFGLLYAGWACLSILLIRYSDEFGYAATIWLITITIGTDIGAYFAGRFIGGAKVAPSISPNKSWAGVGGGILGSIILSSFFLYFTAVPLNSSIIKLVVIFSLISQCGDFFESYIKRRFSVKDTGSFMPGHGGILDRMDGQIFLLIAAAIFAFFAGPMDQMAASLLIW